MSILNVTTGKGIDYSGMIYPRPTKSKNGGIGGGRKKNVHEMKRSTLNPVSPKQRVRTGDLQKKLKRMIAVQEIFGYNPHCQKCLKAQFEGNEIKLYADHVGTRNQNDADRYENLGILCYSCNSEKGSVREDYRPAWFVAEMEKLDKR